jgi:hypothetical protein
MRRVLMSPVLEGAIATRRFWTGYLGGEGRRFDWEECHVELPITGEHHLQVGLDHRLAGILSLRHTGQSQLESLADDETGELSVTQGRRPHALRWDEVDLIGRCMALTDPQLSHPGLVVALLARFAPLTASEDADVIVPLLATALRQLPGAGLTESDVRKILKRHDARLAKVAWHWDERVVGDWYVFQTHEDAIKSGWALGTYRRQTSPRLFPYERWSACMASLREQYASTVDPRWLDPSTVLGPARRMLDNGELSDAPKLAAALRARGCAQPTILAGLEEPVDPAEASWIVELLLGVERGTVIRRHFGPTWWQFTRYRLSISVKADWSEQPAVRALAATIDKALRSAKLGRAAVGGHVAADEVGYWSIKAAVDDDLDRGVALIQEAVVGTALTTNAISLRWPDERLIYRW